MYVHCATWAPVAAGSFVGGQSLVAGYRNDTTLAVGYSGTYTTGGTAGTVPTLDALRVGAYYGANSKATLMFFDGAIGEIVCVLDYNLEDRQRLEGYLAHKWSMQDDLPEEHPYKQSPPMTSPPGTVFFLR